MTQRSDTFSVMDLAEHDMAMHLRYLNGYVVRTLLFAIILIIIDILYVATTPIPEKFVVTDIIIISPDPILLTALLASTVTSSYLLRRIKSDNVEMAKIRNRTEVEGVVKQERSITDINYDAIDAINNSLKVWPIIGILLIIYLIDWIWFFVFISPLELTIDSALPTALGIATIIISVYYLLFQTLNWMAQKRKIRELEDMEKMVIEELHINNSL